MKTIYESILSSVGAGNAAFPNRIYKVGDILFVIYSYYSIIPTFYQVVGLKGKSSVVVKELAKRDSSNGMQGTTMPEKDTFVKNTKELTVRISKNKLKIDGLTAYKWNGEPLSYDYSD